MAHVRVKGGSAGLVALVVDGEAGDVVTVQAVQHLLGHRQLLLPQGVGGVRHLDDDVRPGRLLQGALEGLHQVVGQPGHKPDRVHQQHRHPAGQGQLAAGGVQGGKQHVRLGHAGAAQGVHQAGFAHVGVAHQAHHRHPGFGPGLPALAAALFHLGQPLGQGVDPGVDVAAVQLQLGLAGAAPGAAAAPAAAALAAQAFAHSLQPGQAVFQQGQLGLQLAFIGDGPAAENFQNQHGAVDDLHPDGRRNVADLAAGQLPVKDGALCPKLFRGHPGFLQLAAAQQGAGLRGGPLLDHFSHSLHVVGLAQGRQLPQAPLTVPGPLVQSQQQGGGGGRLHQNIVQFAQSSSFLLWAVHSARVSR